MKLFFERLNDQKNDFLLLLCLLVSFLILTFTHYPMLAYASDGTTEALQLRYQAEMAIAKEQAAGHHKLAKAMKEALPGLLQEYLVTRDGTLSLDTVDAAFVEEQFKVARAMEEPGVALALDVYSGPGTGYEHGLRTSIANLAGFHTGRASDAAVDAHERIMERQLANLDSSLARFEAKLNAASAVFDSKTNAGTETIADRTAEQVVSAGATLSVTPSISVEVTAGATVEKLTPAGETKTVTAINTIQVSPGNGPAEVTQARSNSNAGGK